MKFAGKLLLLLSAIALAAPAAEPIKVPITREQILLLHEALCAIQPGLAPSNVVVAADDINALQPIADGVTKANIRMQREQIRIPESAERSAKIMTLADAFDAKTEEVITLELQPLEVTSDEIKEARIAPKHLALVRRYLRPKKAP